MCLALDTSGGRLGIEQIADHCIRHASAVKFETRRLMRQAFPQTDTEQVGRLLLNYVLSDPYVDVALIGMRDPHLVEVNNAISDDAASRIDLAALRDQYVR